MKSILVPSAVQVITSSLPRAGRDALFGFEIQVERGSDGCLVVNIDTAELHSSDTLTDAVPKLRVYVNDDSVWESVPYPEEAAE